MITIENNNVATIINSNFLRFVDSLTSEQKQIIAGSGVTASVIMDYAKDKLPLSESHDVSEMLIANAKKKFPKLSQEEIEDLIMDMK